MSKQTINLGTAPTGAGGDTPRSAFTKTQSNFDELYTALGAAGSPATLPAALPITKGGTGGNTQAAARTALGLKSAALADVVGTVSQSGGVPNGAIIERGTNVGGAYVRYADGTQICMVDVTQTTAMSTAASAPFYTSPVLSVTWPISFSATPFVTTGAGRAATDGIIVGLQLRSWSSADCYFRFYSSNTSASLGCSGFLIAAGRWF